MFEDIYTKSNPLFHKGTDILYKSEKISYALDKNMQQIFVKEYCKTSTMILFICGIC